MSSDETIFRPGTSMGKTDYIQARDEATLAALGTAPALMAEQRDAGGKLMLAGILDDLARQLGGPWGQRPLIAARVEVCELAWAALLRSPKLRTVRIETGLGGNHMDGMPVAVRTDLPLGAVRFLNAAGELLQEFRLSPDDLA